MSTRLIRAALAAFLVPFALLAAQPADPLSPPPNRVGGSDGRFVALTGATIHTDPETVLTGATLIARDGLIVSVAVGGEVPPGARTIDARGLHVYPGFVDPFVEVDALRPDPTSKGVHWSHHVTPQRSALDGKGIDDASAESLRKLGFVAAGLSPRGGVFRGTGAAVSLAKPDGDIAEPRPLVYSARTYHALSFEGAPDATAPSDGRWGSYPGSQMGAIALIRQTVLDAGHRHSRLQLQAQRKSVTESESCLDALIIQAPYLFSVNDELETLRAWAIADEFSLSPIVVGNGTEYKRLDPIAARKPALIVPLNFPEKPRVAGLTDAASVDLRELMAWEQAPTNPRRLRQAGVDFSLTTARLRDKSKFKENLRNAIRHGLSERDALAALTTTPARLLGLDARLGTLAPGKAASFIVADGPIFDKKTRLLDVYCDGVRHTLAPCSAKIEGVYENTLDPVPPGEVRRFIAIDADGGVTVRRATKSEKPDHEPKPEPNQDAQPAPQPAAPDAQPPAAAPQPAAPSVEPVKPVPAWRERSVKAKNVVIADDRVSFVFDHDAIGGPSGVFTQAGLVVERDDKGRALLIKGDGLRADGTPFRFTLRRLPESDWLGSWRVSAFDGKPKPAKDKDQLRIDITHGPEGLKVKLTFTKEKGEPTFIEGENVKLEGDTLTFTHDRKKLGGEGQSTDTLRLTGEAPTLTGEGTNPDGTKHPYTAERWKLDDDEQPHNVPDQLTGLPFGPYARPALPEQFTTLVIFGATVWTSGPDGRLEDTDVIVQNGKIVQVGKGLRGKWIVPGPDGQPGPAAPGTLVIDARGKHLTPGLIDCHSHTGISKGVNEGGQAVTAEVRIGDVTNPDAINWYRQLAGGITTVNNLHGSANAIGGQNQVNKARWGVPLPTDMHFAGAIPGIKFALGENPKWGNGDREGWRYPQTRMGVEALLRDRFTAAKAYLEAATEAVKGLEIIKVRNGPDGKPQKYREPGESDPLLYGSWSGVRRDLELEALAEILQGKRLIHCHSYRQDEILMLGNLAREFGFKIGTYQHILEGYKVAEVVADSGGGSCFSDWWAYKVEVQDAIPQAGPIMHEQGVVVSFNSDSDEMARRMHVEAAKARKYSRLPDGSYTVTEEQALQFVTLNPAKQLRIDDKVGSIQVGKDADLALWSGHPLSTLTRCERTFIDGRQMFSLEEDAALRQRDAKERQRLIQKLLADKSPTTPAGTTPSAGGTATPARRRPPNLLHAALHYAHQRRTDRALDMVRLGYSTEDAARGGIGACGCDDLDNWSNR